MDIVKRLLSGKRTVWAIFMLLLLPGAALAHERFIPHAAKWPIDEHFFTYLNSDMLNIAARVMVIMAAMLFVWFMREPIYNFIIDRVFPRVGLQLQDYVEYAAAFVFDKPVRAPKFTALSKWVVVFFLRCPALVLMFAAANNALVMPSYPLEPSTRFLFQIVQVIMAIGILTQSFLPLGGATIFGTFVYLLFAFDWKIAVDVLPVLTVAVVYVSASWDSWKQAITTITPQQMKWVRIVLGFGFFALGWMKIYNYYLSVGVADNFPAVMHDPMIQMFWYGTGHGAWSNAVANSPAYMQNHQRECWILGFAIAEVLTGFLLMVGVFCRVWCLMMVYVFTKLMVMDFGWAEIPHLYPIGAFLVVLFSNNLSSEFGRLQANVSHAVQAKQTDVAVTRAIVAAIFWSFMAVMPILWLLTKVKHPSFQ